MRVAVVAEFYPRRHDPVLGVWAHRQALAARDAGAEVSVFVLHRLIPPRRQLRALPALLRQPSRERRDGLDVRYVRFVSPPRGRSYAHWGAWAAPALSRALRRAGTFDVIHAHNAVPAGDAALRAGEGYALVVSVHGGDVLWVPARVPSGAATVSRVLGAARVVLANSTGVGTLASEHGARSTRVVHLGADVPAPSVADPQPLVVSLGHLVARKRHADVMHAVAALPGVRYRVIGDGPERGSLERLAAALGISDRVELTGQLEPRQALSALRGAWAMALPSTEEAFGVAYIEAMAAGIPAIGCRGEPGPEEIAAVGEGIVLVAPRSAQALTQALRELLGDRERREALATGARLTVEREFTWERCGERTLAAYEAALA